MSIFRSKASWIGLSALLHLAIAAVFLFSSDNRGPLPPASVEVFVGQSAPEPEKRLAKASRGEGLNLPPFGGLNLKPSGTDLGHAGISSSGTGSIASDSDNGQAFEPTLDRKFSGYRRLHSRIDSSLVYPGWLQRKEEEGMVTAALFFHAEKKFEIQIRSESRLLRVHVTRMFRELLEKDLQSSLHGLEHAPIFFYLTFSGAERPVVEIHRVVHKNRLYFERGPFAKESLLQLKESKFRSAQAEPKKYLELNVTELVRSRAEPMDASHEEEYRVDPAYRDDEVSLQGTLG